MTTAGFFRAVLPSGSEKVAGMSSGSGACSEGKTTRSVWTANSAMISSRNCSQLQPAASRPAGLPGSPPPATEALVAGRVEAGGFAGVAAPGYRGACSRPRRGRLFCRGRPPATEALVAGRVEAGFFAGVGAPGYKCAPRNRRRTRSSASGATRTVSSIPPSSASLRAITSVCS